MARWRWVAFVLLGATLTITTSASARGHKNWATAEALIAKAKALSNLEEAGSQPFHLEATFELRRPYHQSLNGTFTLDWVSADKWREEIEALNFAEIQVGNTHNIWRFRTSPYEPLVAYLIPGAFRTYRTLDLQPHYKVSRPQTKKGNTCMHVHTNQWTTETLCFDSASGVLAMRKVSNSGPLGGSGDRIELDDYRPFGAGLLFPWKVSDSEGDIKLLLYVKVLSRLKSDNSSLLLPPAGAQKRPGCSNPQMPTPIRVPPLGYPESEGLQRMTGVVLAGVSVGAGGAVQQVTIFESPSKDLTQAAAKSIKQWRFKPAMCGKEPVPRDIYVQTCFNIQ